MSLVSEGSRGINPQRENLKAHTEFAISDLASELENPCAYVFKLNSTLDAGLTDDSQRARVTDFCLNVYRSGSSLRHALRTVEKNAQVIILQQVCDVSPLNLVAALHKDDPQRDIYLLCDDATGHYISSARAAGSRGVIDTAQAEELLNLNLQQNNLSTEREQECGLYRQEGSDDLAGTDIKSFVPDAHEPSLLMLPIMPAKRPELLEPAEVPELLEPLERFFEVQAVPLQQQGASFFEDDDEICSWDELESLPAVHPLSSVQKLPAYSQDSVNSGRAGEQGIIVSFFSGRGGTGKSTLSLLCALILAQQGQRVALLDLDLQFGDLSYLAGREEKSITTRKPLGSLLSAPANVTLAEPGVYLIEAPTTPEVAEDLLPQIPDLLAALRNSFDCVVINTATFWTETAAHIAQQSDRLCFVMDQRATAVRASKQAAELCVRLQIPSTRFVYLLNKSSRNAPISDLDASLALDGAPIITIADGGPVVDELLALGCPSELLQAVPGLADSLTDLLQKAGLLHNLSSHDSGVKNASKVVRKTGWKAIEGRRQRQKNARRVHGRRW